MHYDHTVRTKKKHDKRPLTDSDDDFVDCEVGESGCGS